MIQYARYDGRSLIFNRSDQATVQLATNTLREATYFEGRLSRPLLFREAMATLYQVVISDRKYRPRDRFEFQNWLAEQDRQFLANLALKSHHIVQEVEKRQGRLAELDQLRKERLQPFYNARRRYFEYVYENQFELNYIFDPVITVHPDELSFEAFSRDESVYARVAVHYEMFGKVDSYVCGTTNIDFSSKLHHELEKMRDYRDTRFAVQPSGFSVQTDEARPVIEKKIDLPETWVKGFLQVHAVMSMGLTRLRLAPIDLYNLCRLLTRRQAKVSPRSLRWELDPGKPARLLLEPWNQELVLTGTPTYSGTKAAVIRTWGRDRIRMLARLLPLCEQVDVYLAGYGLPSFFVLSLGPITFTLGLSGWTDVDWSGGTKLDLLTRQADVSAEQLLHVYETMQQNRFLHDEALQKLIGLPLESCRSALSYLCQSGRAMYDLDQHVYRFRELFFAPFTLQEAKKAVKTKGLDDSPAAQAAQKIYENQGAMLTARRPVSTGYKLSGSVKGTDQKRYRPVLHLDHDQKIIEATCTCKFFNQNKLLKGPCEHMLALMLLHRDRL